MFRLRAWARTADESFTLKYYSSELENVYVYGTQYPLAHAGKEEVAMALDTQGNMGALPVASGTLDESMNVVGNKQKEE